MSFEVQVEVPVEELEDFIGDVVNAVDEWKLGVLDEIRKDSTRYSRRIASRRMPSGGGDYVRRIKWRDISRGPEDYVGELYNDHQWARAVEGGTKPHDIASTNLMRAQPLLEKKGGKERPWGMKYGGAAVYGRRFQHPGARAFHIFRDTARHIAAVSKRIVEQVFRRIRKI